MKRMFESGRALGLAALLVAATGLLGGCGSASSAPSGAKKQATVQMPDYSMTEIDDAGRELVKMGLKVTVVRPAFTVKSGEKTTKPGTSFDVTEYMRPFKEDAWDHWVTQQEPAADTVVAASTNVTLTAGEHLGASPGKSWLEAHGEVIKKETDKDCLKSCHKKKHCTDCHDKAGVKEKEAPRS